MTIGKHGKPVNVEPGVQGFQETKKGVPVKDTIDIDTAEPKFDISAFLPSSGTRQSDKPLERLNLQAQQRSAREMIRLAEEGQIDINPAYQRPSVWSAEQKQNLVKSWLSGVPIPALVVNDRFHIGWTDEKPDPKTGKGMYAVVDGKQRIEAGMDWQAGRLPVPASWFEDEFIDTTIETEDGPYVTNENLTDVGRRLIESRMHFAVVEGKLGSVEAEAELYMRLNTGGTAHTDADLDKARAFTKEDNR
ncbi:DUF262 domain-containing protein [Aeromicrobium sp. 179-A 4D2 NHS]|uniref:DUF262 domain-containing protein n=1 Tax=Aeromicrobium sp. 179-A 4D2 NHS TaxID=3142375 RepID=UPI0039A262B3